MQVRVRFAPSPTGYLHVGGARTALFNWLYARKTGGKFILRIEDTDLERSTAQAVETILDGLRWLGLDWDEGPFYQTANLELHRQKAEEMVASGHAYRCFCSKELLEERRKAFEARKLPYKYEGTCRGLSSQEVVARLAAGHPYVIRFAVPRDEGAVSWTDLVYGEQSKQHVDIEDFVMVRADSSPLYILSNAVDDALQGVTHVIRGQDGIPNTPKQILIYKALGYKVPEFAHLPLILDPSRAKLSKRLHGDVVMVKFYQERGFLPDALANFLLLLGWSPGDDREFFSREEMIEAFSFEGINRSNSIFNFRKGDERNFTDPKAIWMNAEYISKMPLDRLLPFVIAEFKQKGLWRSEYESERSEWFAKTIDLLRARYRTLSDFTSLGRPYFEDDFDYEPASVSKNLKDTSLVTLLPGLADKLEKLQDFSAEAVEAVLRTYASQCGVKAGLLINAARTALTGQSVGPGMFDVFATIGQRRSVERLRRAVRLVVGQSA